MNKQELERRLQEESLLEFNGDDGLKKYVDGDDFFYNNIFHNRADIFGIYKNNDATYAAFVTDTERGYPKYRAFLDTEEEACDWLYEFVKTYE